MAEGQGGAAHGAGGIVRVLQYSPVRYGRGGEGVIPQRGVCGAAGGRPSPRLPGPREASCTLQQPCRVGGLPTLCPCVHCTLHLRCFLHTNRSRLGPSVLEPHPALHPLPTHTAHPTWLKRLCLPCSSVSALSRTPLPPRSLLLWLCLGLAGRAWGYEVDAVKVAKAAPYAHRVIRASRGAQRGLGVCAAMPGVEHCPVEQVGGGAGEERWGGRRRDGRGAGGAIGGLPWGCCGRWGRLLCGVVWWCKPGA